MGWKMGGPHDNVTFRYVGVSGIGEWRDGSFFSWGCFTFKFDFNFRISISTLSFNTFYNFMIKSTFCSYANVCSHSS